MLLKEKASFNWLIGKKDDLYWITGSSGVSLLILAIYFFLTALLPEFSDIQISEGLVIGIIFLVWTFFFDSTHFFATYSRTYLDKQYLKENKSMLLSSLCIFLLGPLFLLSPFILDPFLSSAFEANDSVNLKDYSRAIFALVIFGSVLWGYYHLVRQHWGFVALYQKKNKENNSTQYILDALLLAIGCSWPLLFYFKTNLPSLPLFISLVETLQQNSFIVFLLSLSGLVLTLGVVLCRSQAHKVLGKLFLTIAAISICVSLWCFLDLAISIETSLFYAELFFRYAFLACLVAYCTHTLFLNQNWNLPKFLLIASVLLTHNLVLLSVSDFLLISACLTIFHNIQYHRIVRYFNVNHYQSNQHGISLLLTQKLSTFIFVALIFSAVVLLLRGSTSLAENTLLQMILITSLINGISLHHYFLDGIIWRTSKDKNLSQSLKLG